MLRQQLSKTANAPLALETARLHHWQFTVENSEK
jgi:hypothetical protein